MDNREYVDPFIDSVHELFRTMLHCEAVCGEVSGTAFPDSPLELTAIIGLGGAARGAVALLWPWSTAVAVVTRFAGHDLENVEAEVADGVAELVNIVAGAAKAKLRLARHSPIDLGLPAVVYGTHYQVRYPACPVWFQAPFETTLGPFHLRVMLEPAHGMDRHAQHAAER